MKKTILLTLVAVLALGVAGCASIPCAAPNDTATCTVAYYVSVSDQIDISLQALVTGVPAIPANVRDAINKFHTALPSAQAAAKSALAAYEAGTSKDYVTAMNALIALYLNVNGVIVSAGYADQVAPAKVEARVKALDAIRASSRP